MEITLHGNFNWSDNTLKYTQHTVCHLELIVKRLASFLPQFMRTTIVLFIWSLAFFSYPPVFAESLPLPDGEARMFTLTGYYSPLPNQPYFLTGSYESEIRLNGQGIAAADGTPVYPGMLAAPANYEYGMKICLPDFGCGKVHDRGQAIVKKGERDLARNDRLDLWMGYGLDGLHRALALGVKHVEGRVYSPDSDIVVAVNFSANTPLASLVDMPVRQFFRNNLALGDEGEEVSHLQEYLQSLGYYYGEIDGIFGLNTQEAVFSFQKSNYVVNTKEDLGAGRFGPMTRQKLSEVIYYNDIQDKVSMAWEELKFEEEIELGERSREVAKLQRVLVVKEYLEVQPTGFFGPQTELALIQLQLDHGIIKNKQAKGAGNFGPNTKELVNSLLEQRQNEFEAERSAVTAYQETRNRFNTFAGKRSSNQLAINN